MIVYLLKNDLSTSICVVDVCVAVVHGEDLIMAASELLSTGELAPPDPLETVDSDFSCQVLSVRL